MLIPMPPRSEWPAHILEAHERWDTALHNLRSEQNYETRRKEYGEENQNLQPIPQPKETVGC